MTVTPDNCAPLVWPVAVMCAKPVPLDARTKFNVPPARENAVAALSWAKFVPTLEVIVIVLLPAPIASVPIVSV